MNSDLSDLLADYHFDLPEELIAQEPSHAREEARLLVVRRSPEAGLPRFEDLLIRDLPQLVKETPLLQRALWLRNRSRVLPARFYARRATGGRHEIVLLEETAPARWSALVRNSVKMEYPQELLVDGLPDGQSERVTCLGPGLVDLSGLSLPLEKLLAQVGEMPLPPYIRNRDAKRDHERYQPVWALPGQDKSVAAPTASLHFTPELLAALHATHVRFADSVLHVGLGTFEPVRCDRLSEHKLHEERIFISSVDLAAIEAQVQAKAPMLCVGTTALRTLESLPLGGRPAPPELRYEKNSDGSLSGRTHIFIRPGHEFHHARALLTNFHLPESTLFVLVATYAGSLKLAQEAYAHAIRRRYRFFSYGDATLWL